MAFDDEDWDAEDAAHGGEDEPAPIARADGSYGGEDESDRKSVV